MAAKKQCVEYLCNLVAWWLSAIMELGYCGFIMYCSHLYKGVSLRLYSIALINHVYHTTLHYSTQWQKVWNKNIKTVTVLRRNMKERYAEIGPSLYNEIADRNGAVIIAYLRTGHCGLNRYLSIDSALGIHHIVNMDMDMERREVNTITWNVEIIGIKGRY